MKSIFRAGLLISLQAMSLAHAYEADIHYSTTYVLARAVGWAESEALTIASANEGVDENEDTVAALELDTGPSPSFAGYLTSSLRQAEKNLRFHCFSSNRGPAGRISADVHEVMSGHFANVPGHDDDPRRKAIRLIALGVSLHCQQDAHSHVDFGGSCGPYSGTCYGHTHQTFIDHVIFRLVGKHYFNPDHPGVSGRQLLQTLQGTASALATHRPGTSPHSIATHELGALADALRASGLELPDETRRTCNRHIAGKWLFDYFHAEKDRLRGTDTEVLAPEVARACENPSLASAKIVRIPEPRFPRLDRDASPALVRADGTYRLVRDKNFEASLPGNPAPVFVGALPGHDVRKVRIQLSHWSQLLALPLMSHVALSSTDDNRKAM